MANPSDKNLEQTIHHELRNLPEISAPVTLIARVHATLNEAAAQQKLEAAVHRCLRELPERAAPATLIPRVLKTIEMRARAWWRQPLLAWPPALRIAVLSAAVILVGALVYGGFVVQGSFAGGNLWTRIAGALSVLDPIWEMAATWLKAVLVLAQAAKTLLIYAAGLFVMMYLACIGLGTACFRLVIAKRI
jgi:hypothetical protein